MSVGSRMRFEVFKRDSFTCQYCGRKAPDVVLHVDHINPVSKGGGNDLINLITSCKDCNLGKSNILLDDKSAVAKRQKVAEELQERREQIEMLMQWHEGLKELDNESTLALAEYWNRNVFPYSVTEHGASDLAKLSKKFGFRETLESIDTVIDTYVIYEYDEESEVLKPTRESVVNAFGKIGGVLYIRSKHNDTPKIVYSIRKTCQNRGLYFDNKRYFPAIEKVRESHGDETLEYIYEQAKQAKSWTQFISVIEELIEDNQDQEED